MAKKATHKLRVKANNGGALVKMLLRHPMETGSRADPSTGETIPRHFIRELACDHNGTRVLTAQWGWGVSRNPYLSFQIKRAEKGDMIAVSWSDNLGVSESIEGRVS